MVRTPHPSKLTCIGRDHWGVCAQTRTPWDTAKRGLKGTWTTWEGNPLTNKKTSAKQEGTEGALPVVRGTESAVCCTTPHLVWAGSYSGCSNQLAAAIAVCTRPAHQLTTHDRFSYTSRPRHSLLPGPKSVPSTAPSIQLREPWHNLHVVLPMSHFCFTIGPGMTCLWDFLWPKLTPGPSTTWMPRKPQFTFLHGSSRTPHPLQLQPQLTCQKYVAHPVYKGKLHKATPARPEEAAVSINSGNRLSKWGEGNIFQMKHKDKTSGKLWWNWNKQSSR